MTTAPSSPKPARLAIVLTHATQYYSPWFRWLAAYTALTIRVFYLSEFGLKAARDEKFGASFAWDVDLTGGYEWEVVPNTARTPDTLRYDGIQNPDLPKRLAAWEPDAIFLFGYNYHTHLRLIPWARLHRIPLIFRGDSHLLGRAALPLVKRTLLQLIYRQFTAVTYVGHANRTYFERLGVPAEKLFFAPHAVDAERFRREAPEHRERADAVRAELNVGDETLVVLFAGKLIPSKQPHALLDAFLRVAAPDSVLVYVGDGPEKNSLMTRAAELPNAPVHFLPFTNQSEMPARYLAADLYVLPSRGHYETWGLAVNEAMHMGVPCLVSDQVGCHLDLIREGATGWVFSADSENALETALRRALAELRTDRQKFAAAVAAQIAPYSYQHATYGLLRAVDHALQRRPANAQ